MTSTVRLASDAEAALGGPLAPRTRAAWLARPHLGGLGSGLRRDPVLSLKSL
jgi:hypothetical protein